MVGSCSAIIGDNCWIAVPNPLKICVMRGSTLSAAVPTLDTKFSINVSRSALESPMPVIRFVHAACIIPTEPSMVVAASFAVVPVIPRLSWTAWIAVITSENLAGSRACPVSFSASATSRSSSDFVPPYNMFAVGRYSTTAFRLLHITIQIRLSLDAFAPLALPPAWVYSTPFRVSPPFR